MTSDRYTRRRNDVIDDDPTRLSNDVRDDTMRRSNGVRKDDTTRRNNDVRCNEDVRATHGYVGQGPVCSMASVLAVRRLTVTSSRPSLPVEFLYSDDHFHCLWHGIQGDVSTQPLCLSSLEGHSQRVCVGH